MPWIGASLPNWNTLAAGIASFFRPNPLAFLGWRMPLAAEAAGYYSTAPLQETLSELVDFSLIGEQGLRLTTGAEFARRDRHARDVAAAVRSGFSRLHSARET